MILGIGVDILHLPRFQRLFRLRPERLITRILTKSEQDEFFTIQARIRARDAPAVVAAAPTDKTVEALSSSSSSSQSPSSSASTANVSAVKIDNEPTSAGTGFASASPSSLSKNPAVTKIDLNDELLRYLASRWALKEASFKALYPHHTLTWQDVTIVKENGKPCVRVAENFGVGKTHATVSHDGEYLIGQVLFESP
ncbi:hypothetical protein EMPS_09500 [Entomortierella parvispora]|uniref:4'-phosphopantetheinyl transferase domain-containing protein n=1 Tax=Entomortierella parvispora TaxID=205924 RepID=A0A9P3M035_9FUNG|nr:hypothetical protein EMPS_09500 [Entomortierella parvispora]